jgi:hypothetical protein
MFFSNVSCNKIVFTAKEERLEGLGKRSMVLALFYVVAIQPFTGQLNRARNGN